MPLTIHEELLNATEVRKILKVSLSYVHSLASRGELRAVRLPCQGQNKALVRFKLEDVRQFIESHYK